MRTRTIFLILLLCPGLAADNLEKTQKKDLEAQVKIMTAEAEKLEKAGQLVEARAEYAKSLALTEVNGVTDALKHIDEEIRKRIKNDLNESRKLYETRKYQEAATILEEGMKLQAFQPVLSYNLSLCYYQLGDRSKATEYLVKAKTATADPKQKQKLSQLLTFYTTGENGLSVKDSDKAGVIHVNSLADSIGLDASLEDQDAVEEPFAESGAPPAQLAAPAPLKTSAPTTAHSNTNAGRRASLCSSLDGVKSAIASSPSATFNLANCAETNGRTAEAVRLLEKYLEMTPNTLDADEARARIADLKLLLDLPGQNGADIRRLYASAYGSLAERKYDRALAGFSKAGELDPAFAPTEWNLALLYEAMGNVDRAREKFTRYRELTSDPRAEEEAGLHLSTLDAKRAKYDEEVDATADIVANLFNRAMNLTFNGDANRSAIRAQRARVAKKDKGKEKNRVGGFAIPFVYAQQELTQASEHLQVALALFPLGAEANELMGLVFLQANDGTSATKSFDVVASQNLPVPFYAEMRGHGVDRAVKAELNRDGIRLIFLSSYYKKGVAAPPTNPAGEDGLGDIVVEPSAQNRQGFDSLDLKLSDIKKVETDKGLLKLKLTKEDIYLSPIYLPSFTPVEGPPARRFANNYTRLFVRYPGLEDSKLGTEGMSGGEKFMLGYKIATAGADIAMSGFTPISAISSVQDAISIARTIQAARVSLSVSFASWEKSAGDQQQLLAGKAFKSIPIEPAKLTFVEETN
jgi:tetratricopeptide (TPR) repeat protein